MHLQALGMLVGKLWLDIVVDLRVRCKRDETRVGRRMYAVCDPGRGYVWTAMRGCVM